MALTQVSLQLTEAQVRQIGMLQELGFGTRSDILRLALDRMYRQEFGNGINPMKQETQAMNTQNKINVVLECLLALRRGVSQPTVVVEGDGSYSYIPGAYLTDASYTGSRSVLFDVAEASFGPEFDVDTASDAELQAAAEWAAAEWDWTGE